MRDYGITFLFHDRHATANMDLRTARSTGHASVEWVMGVISLQTLCGRSVLKKKARKYSTVFKIRLCILCREYEKNREFSTIILIYLGDNTIYDHSYNGRPILIGTYT